MIDVELWGERRQSRPITMDGDVRSPFQRDKARIMHAASFRRLQAKKQVIGVGLNDFYRTRLTHSLEAAQISSGIISQLRNNQPELTQTLHLDEYLLEAICLAHDIGHPPFGHSGEVALHYMMHNFGGFEGNAQTFRILTHLEPYTEHHGMNLARRTLLGVIKYPGFIPDLDQHRSYPEKQQTNDKLDASRWAPPKGLYIEEQPVYEWLMSIISPTDKATFEKTMRPSSAEKPFSTQYKSVDCAIMELADDIAYGIHDLEDALAMKMVDRDVFNQEISCELSALDTDGLSFDAYALEEALFSNESYKRKNAIGFLVNAFISPIRLKKQYAFSDAILEYTASLPEAHAIALNRFKQFVFKHVILQPQIQIMNQKGQQVLMSLFEVYANEPEKRLPKRTARKWLDAETTANKMRVIADYIGGMTDQYAYKKYSDLFLPKNDGMTDR